jgi:hypothetical protein
MEWNNNVTKVSKPSAKKAAPAVARQKKAAPTDPLLQNPPGFGGKDSAGNYLPSQTPMFDKQGQLNAWDKKDVYAQQEMYQDIRTATQNARGPLSRDEAIQANYLTRVANHESQGEEIQKRAAAQKMLADMFSSEEGRMKLAAGQVPLILSALDYEGFSRNVLLTHSVAQGEIISYEKDIAVTASIIEEDGQSIRTVVRGNRIFPSEFFLTALNLVPKGEIARKQYDIVDRAHDKTVYQIMLKEDRNLLKLLYKNATIENDQINLVGDIDKSAIESLVVELERNRLLCDKILMNRIDWGSLRKNVNSTDFDPLTSRDTMVTGMFAKIWNHKIMVTAGTTDVDGVVNQEAVPQGVMFAVTEPRYLGAMPVRIELEVNPADQFILGELNYGWLFSEMIGQIIVNPKAVSMAVKAGSTIPSYLNR